MLRHRPAAGLSGRRRRAAWLFFWSVLLAHGLIARAVQSAPASAPLHLQQQELRERLTRLESVMLTLERELTETEPDKAERLRTARELAGSLRVGMRMDELVPLLRDSKWDAAEKRQQVILADLQKLLDALLSEESGLDQQRAERERLERNRRAIRSLLDEQLEQLGRTSEAAKLGGDAQEGAPSAAAAAGLPAMEQAQRASQRAARELEQQMRGESRSQDSPPPGAQELREAGDNMQQAADRLGEADLPRAAEQQTEAARKLQEALDELDDALRQIRQEEREGTLAALEARLRSMLEREKSVRDVVADLSLKPAASRSRADQLRLTESAEIQAQLSVDAETIHRILIDEGTTVIVPELIRQLGDEFSSIAAALEAGDVAPRIVLQIEDVVSLLEELLAAVEVTRQQEQGEAGESGSPGDQPRPLLPGSAELKLLRSSQLRINDRTRELSSAAGAQIPGAGERLERLAQRQRQLAELALRMNQRRSGGGP